MQPEDVLVVMAQLGVAIAGFNGIATALSRSRGERRSEARRVAGSVLVTASTAMIAWSVAPLVLLTTSISPPRVWQMSSLGWAAYQVAITAYRARESRNLGLRLPGAMWIGLAPAFACIGLQIWNGVVAAEAWPHLVGVASSLLVAMTTFFILVHEDEPAAP